MGKLFFTACALVAPLFAFAEWNVSFDEKTSALKAENEGVSINGTLSFKNDGRN